MIDSKLVKYAHMWTTDRERFGLIEMNPAAPLRCLVLELEGGVYTIDEPEEVVAAIVTRMRSAGVRVMTPDEARNRNSAR